MIGAGHFEVAMRTVWASACRVSLAIGAVAALLGCAPDQTPQPLLGTWYSEDARFDGRTLEINPEWIFFMRGPQELGAIQVLAVKQEGSGEGPIHFEIEGIDREGQDATLSFEMRLRPTELLQMETQPQPWRRTPRVGGPKGQRAPWQRKARVADPEGAT
jgi:membrane-bound lytic murein transglycosylase